VTSMTGWRRPWPRTPAGSGPSPTLPRCDPRASAAELSRAVEELGFAGTMIHGQTLACSSMTRPPRPSWPPRSGSAQAAAFLATDSPTTGTKRTGKNDCSLRCPGELWSVLYLATERTPEILAAQAEWQSRLLPGAADQMAIEADGCQTR